MDAAKQLRGAVSYHAGRAAELTVAQDYIRRGYVLACERWRAKRGEIDLIMRHPDGLVFVEVKASKTFDDAAARITPRQIARIFGSAEEFVSTQPRGALTNMRFDVALVNQTGALRILENALGLD